MRIGLFGGDVTAVPGGFDEMVATIRAAEDQGFATFWLPQIFGLDALTTIAVAGRETTRIELGTSVVPTWPRHPSMLAGQAATANLATGGRLALGIGLSHPMVVEGMWGQSFDRPLGHMREYLEIVLGLLRDGAVTVEGESWTYRGPLQVPGATPCPVLVAALGPRMLELTGRVADGTITWMTGPKTLESHVVPSITRAAEAAGRPAPRVAAGLIVAVTDDPDDAREKAGRVFAAYGGLPSYRAMLDREGVEGPADVVVAGDEATVGAELRRLADIGVTDLAAAEFGRGDDARRTRDLLRSLL